ncbi:Retrovirus-related Pol polyprotein from transposon 17.6 [Gossypium australe]|uniref:Retrovirus-related Pol polyprotein from transposon 17.6 n=1 Tax=Gossypium australe TaxID=47621 RepID=A0A5B6UT68_9ROSI|nr:Retrovirus-related Pol polyprotein from transposon 17.6 [Gossypium australe]
MEANSKDYLSIEEPPKLELNVLPSHLKYVYLGNNSTLPMIVSVELTEHQEELLIKVLKEFKKGICWTIVDIRGISPSFFMQKIIMEEDSSWVSLVQCIPKKGGIMIVENERNELISTRTIMGWRICIDYRKLNKATQKDNFLFPFMDQMLDRMVGNGYECFLDGYSRYNQIIVAPKDQHKMTFTCPYGTFAFRQIPFGLCHAPITFQRCVMALFTDMVENFVEWVEAEAYPTNDAKLGTPRAIVSYKGSHFVHKWLKCLLDKYDLKHKIATAYHPQSNGKVELVIREIKGILEKVFRLNRRDWSWRLDDALWAYRKSFKMLLGITPYRLVFEKTCHLLLELENKAHWALK